MAHLTRPQRYNIEDTNVALLGSDLEQRVRQHAGDREHAWEQAGLIEGVQIWRIEQFHVVSWPEQKYGTFYEGDSYIVLNTYKKDPDAESLSFNLHFWLGEDTTQDEAGTAAYKTVELDDHLQGRPVQYREVQGHESAVLLSYFIKFICLRGGTSTGFRHVSEPPPPDTFCLYRIFAAAGKLAVREVPARGSSLVQGDVYVLDKGDAIWQLNTKASVGKERFKAAEFISLLQEARHGTSELVVYDEGAPGARVFLAEVGADTPLLESEITSKTVLREPALYRISDASGTVQFNSVVPVTFSSLASSDVFLLDDSGNLSHPAIYVWIGDSASMVERRLALQYAQSYVHEHAGNDTRVSLVKMKEGDESRDFRKALG